MEKMGNVASTWKNGPRDPVAPASMSIAAPNVTHPLAEGDVAG